MSRDWPDKREQETVFQVEAEGCVKTPKKELEEPSEVGVSGRGRCGMKLEGGVEGGLLSLVQAVGVLSAAWP